MVACVARFCYEELQVVAAQLPENLSCVALSLCSGLSRPFGDRDQASPEILGERVLPLGGFHDSSFEKVEVGSAVHLPLQELQAVDLAFHLPVAPTLPEGRPDGAVVAAQAFGKPTKLGRVALGSLL